MIGGPGSGLFVKISPSVGNTSKVHLYSIAEHTMLQLIVKRFIVMIFIQYTHTTNTPGFTGKLMPCETNNTSSDTIGFLNESS